MAPTTPNDHDLLIALNTKVDSLVSLHAKVDSLLDLKSKVDNVLARLNGHVPEKCIRHDDKISRLEADIEAVNSILRAYMNSHDEQHKDEAASRQNTTRYNWRTVIAIISLLIALGAFIAQIVTR